MLAARTTPLESTISPRRAGTTLLCSRLPRACSAMVEASRAWIRRSWAAKRLKTNRIAMNRARTRRRGWPTPRRTGRRGPRPPRWSAEEGRGEAGRRGRTGVPERRPGGGACARRRPAPAGSSGRPRSGPGRASRARGLALRVARARVRRGAGAAEGSAEPDVPDGRLGAPCLPRDCVTRSPRGRRLGGACRTGGLLGRAGRSGAVLRPGHAVPPGRPVRRGSERTASARPR